VERVTAGRLMELLWGYMTTQLLGTLAELGVADVLASGPLAVDEIAARVGADPDALFRMLRLVASLGVFVESEGRVFGNTSLSELLREDAKPSLRHLAILFGRDVYQAWGAARETAKTGESAAKAVFGTSWFEYLRAHPESQALFNRAMAGGARGRLEGALALPWPEASTVVDIGGGDGTLVLGILAAHPTLHGIVFDLPHVIASTRERVAASPVAERCTCVGGSFFEDPLPAADTFVICKTLHNWNDVNARTILERCRAALKPGGRIVIIDDIIRPPNVPDLGKYRDLQMLVIHGDARERTRSEWTNLLHSAGLFVEAFHEGLAGEDVVVARPAPAASSDS